MPYASRLKASSRGVRCTPANGHFFIGRELLWLAQQIQQRVKGKQGGPGSGLFRLGHERGGVPSYLVGGPDEVPPLLANTVT